MTCQWRAGVIVHHGESGKSAKKIFSSMSSDAAAHEDSENDLGFVFSSIFSGQRLDLLYCTRDDFSHAKIDENLLLVLPV